MTQFISFETHLFFWLESRASSPSVSRKLFPYLLLRNPPHRPRIAKIQITFSFQVGYGRFCYPLTFSPVLLIATLNKLIVKNFRFRFNLHLESVPEFQEYCFSGFWDCSKLSCLDFLSLHLARCLT